jgi:hypothetical protein
MKIVKRVAFLLGMVVVAGFFITGQRTTAQSKAEGSSPLNSGSVEVGDARVTGPHLKVYTNRWNFTQHGMYRVVCYSTEGVSRCR